MLRGLGSVTVGLPFLEEMHLSNAAAAEEAKEGSGLRSSVLCALCPLVLVTGIVTDPPYGLRAGARTLGRATRKGAPKPIPAQFLATHVKPTQKYSSDAVLVRHAG